MPRACPSTMAERALLAWKTLSTATSAGAWRATSFAQSLIDGEEPLGERRAGRRRITPAATSCGRSALPARNP